MLYSCTHMATVGLKGLMMYHSSPLKIDSNLPTVVSWCYWHNGVVAYFVR